MFRVPAQLTDKTRVASLGNYLRFLFNSLKLLTAFRFIGTPGQKTYVHPVPLRKLLPYDLDTFWRYYGGLTTPDCNEIVTWTVFKASKCFLFSKIKYSAISCFDQEPIQISESQMEKMWTLSTTCDGAAISPMIDTFRNVQPTNSRTVYSADLSYRLGICRVCIFSFHGKLFHFQGDTCFGWEEKPDFHWR